MGTKLEDQLARVLTGPARPMTTYCVQNELRSLGRDFYESVEACKSLERRRCQHSTPISATQCLAEIIGDKNQHNYCVATQDQTLRRKLQLIPGTPLVYINRSVVILEPPSAATLDMIKQMEVAKTLPQAFEKSVLNKPEEAVPEPPPRKKKPKAPNPLSMKKKKVDPVKTPRSQSSTKSAGEKTATASAAPSKKRSRSAAAESSSTGADEIVADQTDAPPTSSATTPKFSPQTLASAPANSDSESDGQPKKKSRKRRKKSKPALSVS
ncbi:hypothetical protein PhCBS80983_g04996 [Powellomyces hirtus]|uniref:UTP23 sensor motif region domain-containing protein n=1 Tax=Powellomyces hirtus TaxID=109895 RepID=A0A507DWW4_9FUNG|nr:hypothetical protein PhCBS80983_g04996 [Powellomyces hirtus]